MVTSVTTANFSSKMNDPLLIGIVLCFLIVAVVLLVSFNRW